MNPLEHLTEIANDFSISYQKFRDADVINWVVTLKTIIPNQKGQGDTLEEAIQDLERQSALREFESKLQQARVHANDVETLKANIRSIL